MNSLSGCRSLCISILLAGILVSGCAKPSPVLNTQRMQSRMAQIQEDRDRSSAREDGTPFNTIQPIDINADTPDFQMLAPVKGKMDRHLTSNNLALQFDTIPSVTVAVDKLPMVDFIHQVFGGLLKVNYVISSNIPQKETLDLNLQEPVSPRRLFEVVLEILDEYKIVVREKDGVFHIGPASSGKQPATLGWGAEIEDVPNVPGQIKQIVTLKYAQASDVRNMLANVPETRVFTLPGENALSVTGPREGVTQVLHYISMFDQPVMRGQFVAKIRLKYADIEEILSQIKEILLSEGVPLAQRAGQGGVHFISLERWSTLLVFAAEKSWIDRVRFWVDQMDKPLKTNEKRYFIYFPENSRALDLMQTLEKILGLAGHTDSGTQAREADFLSSLYRSISDTSQAGSGESATSPSSRPAGDQSRTTSSSLSGGGQSSGSIEGIGGLAVDEVRNALIVYATTMRYRAIERLLHQLDIMPPQVLIEAMVAEVTLVDDLRYGMEWYFKNAGGGQTSILSTLGGLGLESAGISLNSVTDSGKFQVMVQALAEEELVQVLSSPRVVVQNGKSATINVGTQVPVITSESSSIDSTSDSGTGVIRTYQYRDTGVVLRISPVVHSRGIVTLKIDQDVSEYSPSGGENPLILNRTLSTEVVSTSGQTLVIGGLIKESKGYKESKVPFLGDLPVVGNLFKTNSRGNERTELVVMITPHIIRSTQEIDDIRKALFSEFKNLKAPN